MQIRKIIPFALLCTVLLATSARAHKVSLFAYAEGGRIYTESYFPDGRPVQQGQIELRDGADRLLVSGTTDEKGRYDCPIPQFTDTTILLLASMGHRNSFTLKKAEIEAGR